MTSIDTGGRAYAADADLDAACLPGASERLAAAIVATQLRALYADADGTCQPQARCTALRPSHRRWLDATLAMLQSHGLIATDGDRLRFTPTEPAAALWKQWEEMLSTGVVQPDHRAYLALIEACLRNLPAILSGTMPATDVLFPGSSMHLVEGIYKHNLIADHFNAVLGETLRAECVARAARGERGLRLLEIGAGTGGTTAALLPMLRAFGDLVGEYCYTDLSRAFLIHAEKHYAPEFPALKTAIFDVCRPLAGQAVERASYDVVIATNVLHATPDMRETVRNAKAVLRAGGLLLLNEISSWSWYTHFTFGLLDGWWLYEDVALRLPGSPALPPEGWARLLKTERFLDIRFPADAWHGLGQQIIAARSDGVVRQRLVTPAATQPATPPAAAEPTRGAREPARHAATALLAAPAPAAKQTGDIASRSDDSTLRAACAELFRETVAAALRMDAREIETRRPLEHYGLDSILVVQLTTHFRKLFPGVRSSLFFEVRSIDGLVAHFFANEREGVLALLAEHGLQPSGPSRAGVGPQPTQASAASPATARTSRRRVSTAQPQGAAVDASSDSRFDVAVIGVGGRYPQSPDLERFWDNLAAGRACTSEIPADRWRWQDYFDPEKGKSGTSYTRWGGFLADIDRFDPLFFRIAPKEARRIDPQERLFLETSYHAIEDSGYTPATLSASRKVGVFVGAMNSRYTVQPLYYSIANRVSFLFDFTGPSFAVDSACSSSLTAIHIAIDNLRNGLCDVAIAGGVSLIVDPRHMLELTAVGMLSEGAHCRSFGRDADGFVDAEGVGAVVLKPLSAALRDGDNIQAVIRGSALNAGGRTHGYTVPNPVAQAEVVADALRRAGVDAAEVSYLEAHGTGTALGDPIEIAGLARAFRERHDPVVAIVPGQGCAIGSVKSNIGHCESAAGIAALTKVLLQLRHGQLAPTLHAEAVNDEIDFAATPFRLQRELAPWQRPRANARDVPRIAGISSFGAGGANAHLIVQEAPGIDDSAVVAEAPQPCLVPLSARTPVQLEARIRQLLDLFERAGPMPSLHDLAYTLQVGREAMEERLVLIAESIDDLRGQLRALVQGREPRPAPARGNTRQGKAFVAECRMDPAFNARCDHWFGQRDLDQLAAHWARGVDLDWSRLHAGARRRRLSLPTYPFARERHWIDPQRTLGAASAPLHPLLARNTSTLRHPGYAVSLDGEPSFLATDAAGCRRLPFMLCVEMVRAAVAAAYPDDLAGHDLCLDDVAVDARAGLGGADELHIALLPEGDDALRFEIDSRGTDGQRVHCQGLGWFQPTDAQADVASGLDVGARAALAQGVNSESFHERLAGLGVPVPASQRSIGRAARLGDAIALEFAADMVAPPSPWGLSPALIPALESAIVWGMGEGGAAAVPFRWEVDRVARLRVSAQPFTPGHALLRADSGINASAATSTWTLAVFDAQGRIRLQANGIRALRVDGVESVGIEPPAALPPALRFATATAPFAPPQVKPAAIRLGALDDAPAVVATAARPRLSLSAAVGVIGSSIAVDGAPAIELRPLGQGAYALSIPSAAPHLVDDLLAALSHVHGRDDAKVLLIEGDARGFLAGDDDTLRRAIDAGLFRALLDCPAVTVAAVRGDCVGAGFLFAALCDLMVGDLDGRYAVDALPAGGRDLLAARFGDAWADDLLFVSGAQSGNLLKSKGWTFPIVDGTEVVATAHALAKELVEKPQLALRLLKQQLARELVALAGDLGATLDAVGAAGSGDIHAADDPLPAPGAGIATGLRGAGVLALRLLAEDHPRSLAQRIAALDLSVAALTARPDVSALVLESALPGFLPGRSGDFDEAASQALCTLLATLGASPVPVVVAYAGDVDGPGWLLGLGADACVHVAGGRCDVDALWTFPALLAAFSSRLALRWGSDCARRVLFGADASTGADLRSLACANVAADAEAAQRLANALAESTPLRAPARLASWRACNAVAARAAALEPPMFAAAPVPQMPHSPVIGTELRDNGVLVLRLLEREAKNMFSPALIQGIEAIFAHIERDPACRAVVLCGFDTYFACGGTRESLLAIQKGEARFTDTTLYHLPMRCRVPVVAAMQGHAIGGGWSFGMFADVRLFSAESRYTSPYMGYGFTPGAGSTFVFPATLGLDLARETLLTGAEYTGSGLAARGLRDACVPRAALLERALALADALAARPAAEVAAIKRRLNARALARIDDVYACELAMHEQSFVGSDAALDGVMRRFLEDGVGQGPATGPADVPHDAMVDPGGEDIGGILKSMLAAELQMDAQQIDEDTPFIDLGLDSITGVTWVRRINERWGTRIEATRVYSHPDLRQFLAHVRGLVGTPGTPSTPVAGAIAATPAPTRTTPTHVPTASTAEVATGTDDAALRAELRRMLAQELHLAEDEIDDQRQFIDLGLDSITGVTWVRRINERWGVRIEATRVYSHPSLDAFARFVAASLPTRAVPAPAVVGATPAAPKPAKPTTAALQSRIGGDGALRSWRTRGPRRRAAGAGVDEPIAVIGMAGQFPQAPDLDAYWRNIAAARDCIDTVPPQRWDIERYFSEDISVPGTTNSRWMGVLADVDAFDPLFFNISPTEAESMDPQQRLMLQNCWHAIEDAAIDPRSLSGSRCGVFIGCGATDYHQRSREHQSSSQGFTGASMSILAARISYFLNLQGPCLSIDTACSSSLVAIASACDSLVAGNCDAALAGGVAVMAGPMMHVKSGQSGMLSVDGRCFAFDHRANGFVPSEGVGAVLLKRLSDAERDGDIIHAVIRGWGVNQDGKTNGITAPSPVSQTRLMREIYDRHGIDPEDIQLVEAHGTGTPLGDPIEVEGLLQAFRHYTDKRGYCVLGSVKGNVGHCLYAAGIAGVMKLALAMRHRQLPPSANFERLNPHIRLDDTPFLVNAGLRPWPVNARGGRMAVVSSFGFSGTNAHLVLEAGPERHDAPAADTANQPVLVPLSAKSLEQLHQRARALADHLDRTEADGAAPSLRDIAYTLQVGREPMEERCALVVVSRRDLAGRLRAFADGGQPDGLHHGSTQARTSRLSFLGQDAGLKAVLVETCLREGKLEKLAELWVDGLELDWDALHRQAGSRVRPKRIPLPLYPFARERYWLQDDASPASGVPGPEAILHPLLHRNVSTLRRQRYCSTMRGDEAFLHDHRVRLADGGVEKVLPGVAYLEMAVAAIADALPEHMVAERLTLSDIVWWRPLIVREASAVEIDLGIDAAGAIRFEITSRPPGASDEDRVLHCQGEAGFVEAAALRVVDPGTFATTGDECWTSDTLYAAFERAGLHYGPAHRGLRTVARAGARVVARVARPAGTGVRGDYRLHPGVMDAALQACIGFLPALDALPASPSVPFALQELTLHAPCPDEAVVVLTPTAPARAGAAVEACDVAILAPDGTLCVDLRGFRWRAVDAPDRTGPGRHHSATGASDALSTGTGGDDGFHEAFYIQLLESISRQEMSAEDAVGIGLMP